MSEKQKKEGIKCIAVNLPVDLFGGLEVYRLKTGKSRNAILVEWIEAGLQAGRMEICTKSTEQIGKKKE